MSSATTETAIRSCSIIGVGAYAPEKILSNADLEELVETSDDWITSRTGIKERRIAREDEYTSHMAIAAAEKALQMAEVAASDIDLIIVATITPDMPFPATACLVQHQLGASRAAAFDLEAACSGFVYGLQVASRFIATGTAENALVIGAEKISSIIDWTDRNTCVLFGDGAGAAVLSHRPNSRGIIETKLGADGGKAGLLAMPGGGCQTPATATSLEARQHFLKMDGKETFKNAVTAMAAATKETLESAGMSIEDIDLVIPHQANMRILSAVGDRIGVAREKVFANVDRYGNTSAASVGIALDEAYRTGVIQSGSIILLLVFGAGLTWGASIIEW